MQQIAVELEEKRKEDEEKEKQRKQVNICKCLIVFYSPHESPVVVSTLLESLDAADL